MTDFALAKLFYATLGAMVDCGASDKQITKLFSHKCLLEMLKMLREK